MRALALPLALCILACEEPPPPPPLEADAGTTREPLVCPALPEGIAAGHLGADDDTVGDPERLVVLMGGGPEVNEAMGAFVAAAGGGDVLVLRASGSTESYLGYLLDEVAADPAPASVRVLRLDEAAAGAEEAALCRVAASEAVWLAGGDQSAYLLDWPAALHEALAATAARGAAVGGTSAGAMSLGEAAFDAARGSVTPSEALADPLGALVSVSTSAFAAPELAGFVVDTHFSERGREGRLLAFLARAREGSGEAAFAAVGLDEETALVVEDGRARAFAPYGGAVWLYRHAGEATLAAGAPLEVAGVERARLRHGEDIAWPPVWSALERTVLDVEDGVVVSR